MRPHAKTERCFVETFQSMVLSAEFRNRGLHYLVEKNKTKENNNSAETEKCVPHAYSIQEVEILKNSKRNESRHSVRNY